ncbi:MAG: rhomboid family intramembrane serine protease [Flavobacterium sp.]|nr:rhomboid family intramembrane serine protease [Flavobacterium sp.]
MMQITDTVKHLIIVNVLFFIGASINILPLINETFPLYYFENAQFKWYQPLTHMFMHGGITHIAFNMFALYSFGSNLEYIWGNKKFIFFYFSCGLGAALIHSLSNYYFFHNELTTLLSNGFSKSDVFNLLNEGKIDTRWTEILGKSGLDNMANAFAVPAVGASGAIYGLLVAFGFMFPDAQLAMMFIPVPVKAKYFIPIIIGLDLFSGVTGFAIFGSGIAHFAHVGGAIFGLIIMLFWKKNSFNNNRWN